MPAPVTINLTQAAVGAPFDYTIPDSMELEPLSIFARFDGSAAGAFRPSVSVYSGAGLLLGRFFPSEPVAAGDSADVTFAPFLGRGGGATLVSPDWAQKAGVFSIPNGVLTDVGTVADQSASGDGWAEDPVGHFWTTDVPGVYLIYQHVLWGAPGPPPVPIVGGVLQTWSTEPFNDPAIGPGTTYPWVDERVDGSADPTGLGQSNLEAVLIINPAIANPIGIIMQVRQDSGAAALAFVQQTIVRVTQNDPGA